MPYYTKKQALQIFTIEGTPEDLFKSNNSLAFYYYFKQNYHLAKQFAEKTITLLEQENITYPSAYNNYALILIQLGNFEKATIYLQKAIDSNENAYLDVTRLNQAFLAYKTENYQKALNRFEKVIGSYQEKYPDGHTNIGKSWYCMGQIKALQEQTVAALQAYQKSLHALVPNFRDDDLTAIPNLNQYCRSRRNLLRTLTAKANTLGIAYLNNEEIEGNNSNTVFETFDLAIKIAETLRRSYRAEGSQYFLATETTTLFEQAINFTYQLYQQTEEQVHLEKMLFYIEKSQAPILLQNHLASTEKSTGGVPEILIQREKQLAVDFAFYKNQQAKAKESGDTTKINLYSNYLLDGIQQLNNLKDTLQNQYPQYYKYQYTTSPVDLVRLQNTLDDDQSLLQYYSTESMLYTLAITQQSATVRRQEINPIQSTTKDLLTAIQNPLSQKIANQAAFELLTNAAAQLYEDLIQPALEKVAFSPKRLVIINNGFLTEIPFEVLLTKRAVANESNYLSLDYLVKKICH